MLIQLIEISKQVKENCNISSLAAKMDSEGCCTKIINHKFTQINWTHYMGEFYIIQIEHQ
jgi:hypothetical protein